MTGKKLSRPKSPEATSDSLLLGTAWGEKGKRNKYHLNGIKADRGGGEPGAKGDQGGIHTS